MQQDSPSNEGLPDSEDVSEMLPVLKQLRLGISRNYYAMANVFGLKRIQDYFQGGPFLDPSAGEVWILGERYEVPQGAEDKLLYEKVLTSFLMDYASRLWMTYRRSFPPLGASGLTSDAGWGCTLRSGQMLLAQVLLHHIHGRQWRRSSLDMAPQQHTELAQLLSWFWDSPAAAHPFSLHNLVAGGKADGIVAGEWLGPWTLCHTLCKVVNSAPPAGLQVHLANTPGGSAPVLYTASVQSMFSPVVGAESSGLPPQQGVLLLVPLVLGIGKVNSRYIPQLQAVLQWPQSAGIVGGRPSSSLYFLGCQGGNIIYLDPHEVQDAGSAAEDVAHTYFCSKPRMMPIASIDPSLAIAFYCRSPDSFKDLTSRLKALEAGSDGAPLLNVVEGSPPPAYTGVDRLPSMDEGGAKGEEAWELL